MNKYELIENIRKSPVYGRDLIEIDEVLNLVNKLDEPKKVKVPQFVAEHIKCAKEIGVSRLYGETSEWEIPNKDYFDELFRVSKNQIIWGVNYFDYSFGPGRIVWDKVNGQSSFSDCEIAYCSLHDSTRMFRYMWNGMMQGKSISEGHIQQGNKALNEVRIHPTQKPINLYLWLLQTYAKDGDKILDTHVGSASSLIACQELGFEYISCELDKDIFNLAKQRLDDYEKKIKLF